MINLSLLITFALFGVYGWLCSIECGISLLRLLPNSTTARRGLQLFTPLWEVTNVFLVFGFTAFAVLFNNGLIQIAHSVLSTLVVGLIALIVRALLVLVLFYDKAKLGIRWYNLLFVLASFVVPISFGAAGIVLLTGHIFWQTTPGWWLLITLLLGLVALSISFIYFVAGPKPRHLFHHIAASVNLVFTLAVAILLRVVSGWQGNYPFGSMSTQYFSAALIFISFLTLICTLAKKENLLWLALSPVAIVTPALLALSNRPFLLYPQVSIGTAYGAMAYAPVALIGLVSIFPIMLLGFILLIWLLLHPKVAIQ